jgi:hypothetical protein
MRALTWDSVRSGRSGVGESRRKMRRQTSSWGRVEKLPSRSQGGDGIALFTLERRVGVYSICLGRDVPAYLYGNAVELPDWLPVLEC